MSRAGAWAALVAVSVAVVACREVQEPPIAVTSALADSADQIILGAHQLITDRGVLRAQLDADTAYVFSEGTRIELRRVNTTFFNGAGSKTATLTSREGTYNTQLGQMEARKNVVAVSEDGRRLTTEQLRFSEQANLITSDSAFTATQGARVLRGIGFESDPDMNNVRCKAACRGEAGAVNTAQPSAAPATQQTDALPAAGSRPNTFVLPGQQTPPSVPPLQSAAPAPTPPAVPPAPSPTPASTPPAPTPAADTTIVPGARP